MAASLASSLVTGLVGVPQLPTVVAELCVTSLATTAQLGTLGAAISYYCIAEEREELQVSPLMCHQASGLNLGALKT